MAIPTPPFTDGQIITLPSGKKMQWSAASGRLVNSQPAPAAVVEEVVEAAAAEAQQKADAAQAAAEATAAADAQQKADVFAATLNTQQHKGATDWVAKIKLQDYKPNGLTRAAQIVSPRDPGRVRVR